MAVWSQLIKQYRGRYALKQAALAELVGVNQAAVSRWERGIDVPNLAAQKRLRDLMASRRSIMKPSVQAHSIRSSLMQGAVYKGATACCLFASDGLEAAFSPFGYSKADLEGADLNCLMRGGYDELLSTLKTCGFESGDLLSVENVFEFPSMKFPGKAHYVHSIHFVRFDDDRSALRFSLAGKITEEKFRTVKADWGGTVKAISYDEIVGFG